MRNYISLFIGVLFLVISCGDKTEQKAIDLMELGMHQKAIDFLQSEISKDPKNGDLHYLLALAYIDIGNESFAKQSLNRAFQISVQYKKKISKEYWNRALAKIEAGESDDAKAYLYNSMEYDTTLCRRASTELYKIGYDYLKSNKKTSYDLCRTCFEYSLQFWEENKKDTKYIEMNLFLQELENLKNILEIDSMNIKALSCLSEKYYHRELFNESIKLLKTLRKRKPLSNEWVQLELDSIKNEKISGTVIISSNGSTLLSINKNQSDRKVLPFEVLKYERISDGTYIIDFSGNVFEKCRGWVNWKLQFNKPSYYFYFSDPNYLIGSKMRHSRTDSEGPVGYLFDKLPTNIKRGKNRENLVYNSNIIPENKIRKGSLKLTGNKSNSSCEDYFSSHADDLMEFREVTYDGNPKWIESRFYLNQDDAIKGTGNFDLDKKRASFINQLFFYSPTQKDNILNHKISNGLTKFEFEIVLGDEIKHLTEINKMFEDGSWKIVYKFKNIDLIFLDGLLESWKVKNV
ncbi:MAG: tetratricopeptide repeat protein [Ignavibacteriales bacterium]|nr:tetratricopeptide repeat protein [Ignavibacteriales bacterium]